MVIEITMEKTQRVIKRYKITNEQLEELKNGINPFMNQMESELDSGSCEYDYTVNDEEGKTIVDWK